MKRVNLGMPNRPARTVVNEFVKVVGVEDKKHPLKPPPIRGVIGGGGKKNENEKIGVEELLLLAEDLDPAERKSLLDKLSLARMTTTKTGDLRDVEMWSLAVYEGLGEAIGSRDRAAQGPALVRRLVGAPAVWAPVAEFMDASKLAGLKVTERQAVYSMLARLVIEQARYISDQGRAPLTAKLVGACSANIATIFNQSFPGYLSSGLAVMVARQLIKPGGFSSL